MKKFLTLVLALVLVFGLAVPALAFTTDDSAAVKHPFELSIYLVEYDDNDLFGVATLPASDRGYAKNEIVAAIVELYVPKGENPATDFGSLAFSGKNVKLNVADNSIAVSGTDNIATLKTAGFTTSTDTFKLNSDNDKLTRVAATGGLLNADKNKTYKWLFFGKVTDDDASLTAKLVDDGGNSGFVVDEDDADVSVLEVSLDTVKYTITKAPVTDPADSTDITYTIDITDGGDYEGDQIVILVNKNYKSIGMSIDAGDGLKDLAVTTGGELGYLVGSVVKTSGATYEDIMDVYEDVVVDVFGMDYFNIGHYVRDSFFKDLSSVATIVATVDIEPWTAYVTVPDNIVVDPPKTGDAASIMGFVMVALSGAGAVALKKRG